jgi:methylthioribose-1-phosphate isomerase
VWLEITDYQTVIAAIKEMRIRGAPAIGVAGAYAVALAALDIARGGGNEFRARLQDAADEIKDARPTGANLAWAVRRMLEVADDADSAGQAADDLVVEAARIQDEDEAANRRIGRLGAELLAPRSAVLTHCNAGALATGGFGTALGVILTAWADGKLSRVYATETRPLLQGARLTAWELAQAGAATTLVPDGAAGQLMRRGEVHAVVVGADRIAANGDVANKIGTYSLAVLAHENSLPFYVAAPTTTVDLDTPSGDSIPIEERPDEEVTTIAGVRTAPEGIEVLNRAFDVTPHKYVTAIITEAGVVRAPYEQGLKEISEGDR